MTQAASKNATIQGMYYDYTRVLSYNAFICVVCGGRGIGKTYGAKKLVIRAFLKTGAQFIYLRRYDTEMKTVSTFFADVAIEFPKYEFRVRGRIAECREKVDDDDLENPWEVCGYFVALSVAGSKKSVAYPRVEWVVFDECLVTKGMTRYIPGEYHAFLEFVNTVDRNQDRIRVLMLSNNVDIVNPYFLEWGIRATVNTLTKYRDGLIVVDFPDTSEYAEYASRSRLGRLTEGTDYARYAIDNEPITGITAFIAKKPGKAVYLFSVLHNGLTVSVWQDWDTGKYYVNTQIPRKPLMYTLSMMEDTDAIILEPNNAILGMVKTAYRRRLTFFDTDRTHAQFQAILAFLNTR